jgi:hypothetical protein
LLSAIARFKAVVLLTSNAIGDEFDDPIVAMQKNSTCAAL